MIATSGDIAKGERIGGDKPVEKIGGKPSLNAPSTWVLI